MNHEAATQLIPDFVMGWLSPPRHREFDLHVHDCEECRSLSEVYGAMALAYRDDLGEGGDGSGHPTTEDLVDLAVGNKRFDDEERRQLVNHVTQCAACRMDFEAVQRAETELAAAPIPAYDESTPVANSNGWLRPAAIAAGVVLALLAYPAYLGLFRLPEAHAQLKSGQATRTAIASDPGSVAITLLQSPLRGVESTVPVVEIGDAPAVVLAIEPSALVDLEDDTVIRFELTSPAGAAALLSRSTVSVIREQVSQSGVMGLLVPTAVLEEGRHAVRVSTESKGIADPLFEAPFDVVKTP